MVVCACKSKNDDITTYLSTWEAKSSWSEDLEVMTMSGDCAVTVSRIKASRLFSASLIATHSNLSAILVLQIYKALEFRASLLHLVL